MTRRLIIGVIVATHRRRKIGAAVLLGSRDIRVAFILRAHFIHFECLLYVI